MKDSLTEEETRRALNQMVKQGIAAQVRLTLTESVFLVAFALLLGASNTVIGVLAAVPAITQLLQIPAVYILDKIGVRKKINLLTQLGNRVGVLLMASVPFIATGAVGIGLLVIAVASQSLFTALGSPGWNSWLRDLVPQDRLGRFFSRRMALSGAVAVAASILGGFFIGYWTDQFPIQPEMGYSILFVFAFLAGLVATYYTSTTPEPRIATRPEKKRFSEIVSEPFQDANFRNLIWFSLVWSFSTALVSPFFPVYLINTFAFPMPIVAMLSALTQLVSIIFFGFWGKYSDRFSNKSVMRVTVPIFMVGTFLWTFGSLAQAYFIALPMMILVHFLTGLSAAGVTLASSNIGLKLAPRRQAPEYLAARGACIAVAGTVAPLVGGVLADFFAFQEIFFSISFVSPGGTTVIHTYHLMGLDFLFLISVALGFLALHRLALVKEAGEVEDRIVIDAILAETRQNVRLLSTVDGLREAFQTPFKIMRRRKPKKKHEMDESRSSSNVNT